MGTILKFTTFQGTCNKLQIMRGGIDDFWVTSPQGGYKARGDMG